MSNFEIKSFDGCANPYLGLASIIAAGIDGLRRHLSLPLPVGKTLWNRHARSFENLTHRIGIYAILGFLVISCDISENSDVI